MIWRNTGGHKKELSELEVDDRTMWTWLAVCPLQVHQRPLCSFHSEWAQKSELYRKGSDGSTACPRSPLAPGLQSCCLLLGAWPWCSCLEGFPCVFLWDFLSLGLATLRSLLKHPLFRSLQNTQSKTSPLPFPPLSLLILFSPFIVPCTAPSDIYIYFLIYIYMLYNILYILYILYFVLYIIFICNSIWYNIYSYI